MARFALARFAPLIVAASLEFFHGRCAFVGVQFAVSILIKPLQDACAALLFVGRVVFRRPLAVGFSLPCPFRVCGALFSGCTALRPLGSVVCSRPTALQRIGPPICGPLSLTTRLPATGPVRRRIVGHARQTDGQHEYGDSGHHFPFLDLSSPAVGLRWIGPRGQSTRRVPRWFRSNCCFLEKWSDRSRGWRVCSANCPSRWWTDRGTQDRLGRCQRRRYPIVEICLLRFAVSTWGTGNRGGNQRVIW